MRDGEGIRSFQKQKKKERKKEREKERKEQGKLYISSSSFIIHHCKEF
jgi:hypothetical protein